MERDKVKRAFWKRSNHDIPSCPRVRRGSPLLPEEGKSEARGGGRSEHASRCRTRDSMQRVVARGGALRRGGGRQITNHVFP
jgi:hypothetical protein